MTPQPIVGDSFGRLTQTQVANVRGAGRQIEDLVALVGIEVDQFDSAWPGLLVVGREDQLDEVLRIASGQGFVDVEHDGALGARTAVRSFAFGTGGHRHHERRK